MTQCFILTGLFRKKKKKNTIFLTGIIFSLGFMGHRYDLKKKNCRKSGKIFMGLWKYDFLTKVFFDFTAFLNFFTIKSCVLNKSVFSGNTDFHAFKICFRINLYWRDSPNSMVIVVINSYSCLQIQLLCQTKAFMQFERLNTHWSMFTSDCRWQRRLAVRYNVGFLEQNGCAH